MTVRPLVSVVIPFWNAEAFLGEAIESVMEQTYSTWELILVDDASTDRSAEIARAYASRDHQRVHVLDSPPGNRGVSAARNAGLQRVTGQYVAFLDADDVWLPGKVDEQVRCLEQHPGAVMVYGRMRYWYSWTGRPEDAARDYETNPGVAPDTVLPPPALALAMLEGIAPAPLPSDALLRVAAVRGIGGFEEQRAFSVYEDRVFFVKVALSGGAYVADRCWVKYRQHEGSSSTLIDGAGGRAEARKAYRAWVDTYLAEQGYRGTRLWRLARQRSLPYRHPVAASLLGGLRRARTALAELISWSGVPTYPRRSPR